MRVFVDRETVNDETVVVRRLFKNSGDAVAPGDVILEYETSKTTVESEATEAGVLAIAVKQDDEIPVGSLLFEILTSEEVSLPVKIRDSNDVSSSVIGQSKLEVPELSRKARALAEQLGVESAAAKLAGWVTSADVSELAFAPVPAPVRPAAAISLPERSEPHGLAQISAHTLLTRSKRKRAEARALIEANQFGTTSTIGMHVPIDGGRLARPPALFSDSIADLVVFEAARLLRHFPELNAFHFDESRIGQYEHVNVGISFDNGANLKVLALKSADKKTLQQVQSDFLTLLEHYESGQTISEELLTSSTITISDLSRSAADFMLPLVNGPQSLIIGITRAEHGYRLFGSFDHRVADGLGVSKFLEQLARRVASHFSARASAPQNSRCAACDKEMRQELALGHRGMIKMVLADGREGVLCHACFAGL